MTQHKKYSFVLAAALAAAGFSVPAASASTILKSGDTVQGWTVNFPAGVTLTADTTGAAPVLQLVKGATFMSDEGLDITFVQTDRSASPTILFTSETVTNLTGTSWGGFQFLLANPLPGATGNAAFTSAAQTFKSIGPFTTSSFTPDTVTLSGGTLPSGTAVAWGEGANGGDLSISARPTATGAMKVFSFKEIPTENLVPIPAASWTGLAGLLGLGALAARKRVRRLLA